MSIAEKLTIVAENMQRVYNAGKASMQIDGISINTIKFDDWHGGTSENKAQKFEHKLGTIPQFVSIMPNNVSNLDAILLDNVDAVVYEGNSCCNTMTGECYGKSNTRRKKGDTAVGTTSVSEGMPRGIYKCDTQYVYVNAPSNTYKWAPSDVTTYIMVCIA